MARPKGRPKGTTRYTKAQVEAAIRKRKGKLYLTASDLKVTYSTFRTYVVRWPELADVIRECKGKFLDTVESKLFAALDRKNPPPWAICFFLKTQGKKRGYTERIEQRIGGDKNAPPVQTQNLVDLDQLNLPLEVRLQVLNAMRQQTNSPLPLLDVTPLNGNTDVPTPDQIVLEELDCEIPDPAE